MLGQRIRCALIVVSILSWACNDRTIAVPQVQPAGSIVEPLPISVVNKLDVLFLIDNSPSMAPIQQNLVKNFGAFMDQLTHLPGGLPDIHIAIVTSDMGADGICHAETNDGGRFVSTV